MFDLKRLGKTVKARRAWLGMTQKELSSHSGVSQPTIVRLERGKTEITLSKLDLIGHSLKLGSLGMWIDGPEAEKG